MNLQQLKNKYFDELKQLYDSREIVVFIELILEHHFSFSRTDLLMRGNKEFDQHQIELLLTILERLKQSEPIQYILGEAHFYGFVFKVNPHTLIPRQETEELIYLITKTLTIKNPTILDIGTGSGCIAITLKKELPQAEVFAIDFSHKALEMALLNATNNKANVHFSELDILNWQKQESLPFDKFDVIVSNPPYIRQSEKPLMHSNVLNFEPASALFVEDSDALVFYREIAKFASCFLKPQGKLFYEINEAFGTETAELLNSLDFENTLIHNDLNGKNRFVSATKAS